MSRIRKDELSYFNIFLCLLVIFIHCSSIPVTSLEKGSWQYAAVFLPWRLSGFAVYGFLFLSALKLCLPRTKPFSCGKFYWQRFYKIFLPYIAWVCIYYIWFVYLGYFPLNPLALFRYICVGDLVSHFYFIILLLQFYLLAPLWRKLAAQTQPAITLLMCAFLTMFFREALPSLLQLLGVQNFIYNDRVFTSYLVFWVAGCYAGQFYESLCNWLLNHKTSVFILFAIVCTAEGALSYLGFSGVCNFAFLETLHLLYCICAILFFLCCSILLAQKKPNLQAGTALLDRSTYGIYLSHILVIFATNAVLETFGVFSLGVAYLIRLISAFGITIPFCMLFHWIMQRCKPLFYKQRIDLYHTS